MTGNGPTLASAAAEMARGGVSAVRLLEDGLARLAADADQFHAMLSLNPLAMAEAIAADRQREQGQPLGLLHGLPLVVKDNIDLAGLPTTSGCRALAAAMPHRSATVIDRLRAAGAIIMGKANLSEFSFEIRSRSSLGGDVLHPLRPTATAGGSSGGTAVAVVRGYALAGIGTDTGGSIRIPAAYNGLVGFRPAHGILPLDGIAPLAPSTDTVGPIARTVGDLTLLLRAMDAGIAAMPTRPCRIGVIGELFGSGMAVANTCHGALDQLARHDISLIDVPALPTAVRPDQGDHIVDAEFAAAFDHYLASNFQPGTAPGGLRELVAGGAFLPDHGPALGARMAAQGRETASILASHCALTAHLAALCRDLRLDALAYPTSQVVPDSLDNPRGGWAPELAARTGWPAITVPAGLTDAGMPVGLELLAPRGQEALLLNLAGIVERLFEHTAG